MVADLQRLSEENRRRREEAAATRLNTRDGVLVAPSRLDTSQLQQSSGGSRTFFGGLGSLIRKGQHVAEKALDLPSVDLVPAGKGKKKQDRPTIGENIGQRFKEITSGEQAANTLSGGDLGTRARQQIERVPRVGDVLGTAADVATAPGTLLTVGAGGPAGAAGRMFSEVVSGTGANYASQLAEDKDAPAPVVLASGLAGGVFGFWTGQGLRGSGKALLKEATGLFNRNSARAIATEYGHNIGSRTFVADLLPFDQVRGEVRGPTNAFEETGVGKAINARINPSKNYEGELGASYNTFVRQTRRGQQLAEVAVSSALDPHERGAWLRGPGGTAGRLFDIADDGSIKNITAPAGRSTHWSDVFSTPDAPARYGMSEQQKAYWQDFRQVLDEVDNLLQSNGIQRYKVGATPVDKLYVPRVVRGKNGIDIERTTNSRLTRVFETAEDGVRNGIRYENDPRAVLGLYTEAAYREVAGKQLDDAMAPFLVSPKNILNKTQPKVVNRVVNAAKDLRDARKAVREERRAVIRERADVNKDILREAKKGLTRNPDAGRGVEPVPQPPRVVDTADDMVIAEPRPPAPRSADAAREEIRQSIAEAENFRASLPNVRSAQGPAITDATASRLQAAQKEWASAKASYKRAMDSVRNKELLPEYVFGKSNSDKLVPVGTWKGKFLPADNDYKQLAERINTMTGRAYPEQIDPLSKVTQNIGSTVRFTSAIGDLAMPFIQGLPLLGQNPLKWAKMAALHYAAAANPKVYANYMRRNLDTLQEMAQHGVPIGDIETFTAAEGGILKRLVQSAPGEQTVGRLAAAYDTGLTANRALLWNAMKPHWDGTAEQLASYVRNMTGGLDSAALGVGPTQRAIESVWLGFSPRLMRSTLALVVKAGNPSTAEGQQAARSLLGLAGFATGMAVLANEAMGRYKGESDAQIKQRIEDTLNPLGGRKFLSLNINGQYIGVGGQVRSIAQFAAKAIANPSGFATADQYENPLINYYMSRGSVGVNIAGALVEGATGEKVNVLPFESIDNIPDAVLHVGMSTLPFVIQSQLQADDASGLERAAMAAIGFGGLNYSDMTASAQIDQIAQEQYGKKYVELTGQEQQRMEADHADLFQLRDKQRNEMGGRDVRMQRQKLAQVDTDRMSRERALNDAYQRGTITGPQFRDEMKAVQRDAIVAKKTIRGDSEYQTTDENKLALSAWYDTFDQARISGTDIVDWDKQETLEADLYAKLNPEQRRYIDERRVTQHAPEAQWYFDNQMLIRDSGYYDSKDSAFARFKDKMPQGIESYSQLVTAIDGAQKTGNQKLALQLARLRNAVDRVDDRQKQVLRRKNPDLDRALYLNGLTTKTLTRQALT